MCELQREASPDTPELQRRRCHMPSSPASAFLWPSSSSLPLVRISKHAPFRHLSLFTFKQKSTMHAYAYTISKSNINSFATLFIT
jgi:hypothetical protein